MTTQDLPRGTTERHGVSARTRLLMSLIVGVVIGIGGGSRNVAVRVVAGLDQRRRSVHRVDVVLHLADGRGTYRGARGRGKSRVGR